MGENARLQKAAKATAAALAFHWLGLGFSLFSVPLYLEWLGQERYGLLLTGLAFSSYLMISNGGINWGAMLLIAGANGRGDEQGVASVFRHSFPLAGISIILVAVATSGLVLGAQASLPFFSWIPDHEEFPGLLVAVGSSVICSLAVSPFYNLLVGLQEAHCASICQGCGRFIGTAFALVIASSGASLGWVFSGNIAGAFLAGIAAIILCSFRHRFAMRRGTWRDRAQLIQQLKTGGKSLLMQVGTVVSGSAPVLAISLGAGAQFVPLFSIPMTLLCVPLSPIDSFSASLQPGYGEAMGKGDRDWVANTVRNILKRVMVAIALLGSGFLLLGGPFVNCWTNGKIHIPLSLLASVFIIGATSSSLKVMRFALTGINRHRLAAIGCFCSGIIGMMLGIRAVQLFGPSAIGPAVFAGALLGEVWLYPQQIRKAIQSSSILPEFSFLPKWLVLFLVPLCSGYVFFLAMRSLPYWLSIIFCAIAVTSVFSILAARFAKGEALWLRQVIVDRLNRILGKFFR